MADTVVRKHIIFYGRVQDVGFRYFSVYKARLLGLAGWVKNLDDGSVEMEVQGKESEIDMLIQFLDGHLWIRIDAMDVENIEPFRRICCRFNWRFYVVCHSDEHWKGRKNKAGV